MDKNNVQNLRRMQPGSFFSGYTLMYTFFLIDCYIVYTYTSMYFGVTLMIIYIKCICMLSFDNKCYKTYTVLVLFHNKGFAFVYILHIVY